MCIRPVHWQLAVGLGLASIVACSGDGQGGGGDGGADGDGGPDETPGERFELTPQEQMHPIGGIGVAGFASLDLQDGFRNIADEYWVTEDMTGDGTPDLVVTTVIRDVLGTEDVKDIFDEPYGYPSAP